MKSTLSFSCSLVFPMLHLVSVLNFLARYTSTEKNFPSKEFRFHRNWSVLQWQSLFVVENLNKIKVEK